MAWICGFCALPCHLQVLAFLGLFPLIQLFLAFTRFVKRATSTPDVTKYGKWAVVTGATDGIGLAYAHELAKQGMSIFLLSRTEEKLVNVEEELKSAYPSVEVKHAAFDFLKPEEIKATLGPLVQGMDIGVLINNVGMSYPHPEYLTDLDDDLASNLIKINVQSLTAMSQLILPGMVERKKGCIINIGSAAGVISVGSPLLAVYSGTKAYVDFFSRSLAAEVREKGVHVQCHTPYFVTTKLAKIRRASLMVPTPKDYAKAAINAIGDSSSTVIPFPSHSIQHLIVQSLPAPLVDWYMLYLHKSIRIAALKKKAKKAE